MENFYRNYGKALVQHDAALGGLPNPKVLFGSPIGIYPSTRAHKLTIMKGFNTLETTKGQGGQSGGRLPEEISGGKKKGKGFLSDILGPFSMFNKGGKRKRVRRTKAKKGKGLMDILGSLFGGRKMK